MKNQKKQVANAEVNNLDDLNHLINSLAIPLKLNEDEYPESFDEIAILRKKIKRLEAENNAMLAIQYTHLLREEVGRAFTELSQREDRTIEKNSLAFEGERKTPALLFFVKTKDIKEFRKNNKLEKFSYAMGVEYSQWHKN